MKDYARATREPFINFHLCGTETATVWQGLASILDQFIRIILTFKFYHRLYGSYGL